MMAEKLVATIEARRSGARLIKFAGSLDERNELGELIEKVPAGATLINLSGIDSINSIGSRDWINWLSSLEARGINPVLIACSPAVVAQLNRIKNFAGNCIVKSFQVPYHCDACAVDKLLLVHISELEAPYEAPVCTCDGCGAAMAFTENTDSYFAFISSLPKPKPDVKTESKVEPEQLARGSNSTVVTDERVVREHAKRVSRPRVSSRDSRPSLSAFQLPDAMPKRPSEGEIIVGKPRAMPLNERPYIIAIVFLLVAVVGVLAFMLLG